MTYRTIVSHVREVESSNGSKVKCNYLDHLRFSSDCDLCSGLHYVFVRFAPDRTYSKVYELRTAINLFLDYVHDFEERNPKALCVDVFIKITSEHFLAFNEFLLKNKAAKGIGVRLKGAFQNVSKDFDDGLPLLTLPLLDTIPSESREPLEEDAYCQLTEALKFHIDQLHKKLNFRTLVHEADPYDYEELISDIKDNIFYWEPCSKRVLRSLILNGHPFSVALMEYKDSIEKCKGTTDEIKNIVNIIYMRYIHVKKNNKNSPPLPHLEDVLELYFPAIVDQAAIVLFIMLQTGWNKEVVTALDGSNFEHVLTGAVNSNQSLIISEKNKSQNNDKPFKKPKRFLAPSDKGDKYSVHNLIVLARNLSEPFIDLPIDVSIRDAADLCNPLFLCMRQWRGWGYVNRRTGENTGRYFSIKHKELWTWGIERFFELYQVNEKNTRLKTAKDINGRLRPTWVTYTRNKKKHPLSLIALQQGHASVETTDVYYDSSGPAMQERRKRLRIELNSILSLLQARQFKGLIGEKGNIPVNNDSIRIFTIPGHNKSLWACTNPYKPDWVGHESSVVTDKKCNQISMCLFCSRVCIIEDSLPYLMKRQSTLQEELESFPETEFNSPLTDELEIIQFILQEWNDESALKEASRYLRRNPGLLPRDMQSLSILFED